MPLKSAWSLSISLVVMWAADQRKVDLEYQKLLNDPAIREALNQ